MELTHPKISSPNFAHRLRQGIGWFFRWRYASWWKSHFGTRVEFRVMKGVRDGAPPFSVAFVNMWPKREFAWGKQLFDGDVELIEHGTVSLFTLRKKLRSGHPDCAALLARESKTLEIYFSTIQKMQIFKLPLHIIIGVDVSQPIEKIRINSRSEIADAERRIRKYQLTYDVVTDPIQKERFYKEMFLPFIKTRHTDAARIPLREEIEEILNAVDLLLIKKAGEEISGICLGEVNDQTALMRLIGVKNGDSQYHRFGAIGACYYFSILEAKKRGYHYLSFGGIDPVLTQPMTRFKRKMNGVILPISEPTKECHVMVPLNVSIPGFKSFLLENPFVYVDGKTPRRAVFINKKQETDTVEPRNAFASTETPGIDQTTVFGIDSSKGTIESIGEFGET